MQITDISVDNLQLPTFQGEQNETPGYPSRANNTILLVEPDGSLTKYRLAKKAQCSFPWTHEFLLKLKKLNLAEGTKITNYHGLIDYWLQIKTKTEKKEYMHKDPLSLLKNTKLRYALTTYQAENLVQRYLFPSRTDLYIERKDAEEWHQLLTDRV